RRVLFRSGGEIAGRTIDFFLLNQYLIQRILSYSDKSVPGDQGAIRCAIERDMTGRMTCRWYPYPIRQIWYRVVTGQRQQDIADIYGIDGINKRNLGQ